MDGLKLNSQVSAISAPAASRSKYRGSAEGWHYQGEMDLIYYSV